jgi:hypothetical protein
MDALSSALPELSRDQVTLPSVRPQVARRKDWEWLALEPLSSRLQSALRAPAHPRPGFAAHEKLKKKPGAERAATRSTFDRGTMQTQGTGRAAPIHARVMTRAGLDRALPEPVRTNYPRASTQARGCTLRRSVRPMHCSTRYHTTEVVARRSFGESGLSRANAMVRSLPSACRARLASSGGEL